MIKLTFEAEPKNSRGEAIPLIVGDFVSVNFIGSNEVCAITFKILEKKMDGAITLTLSEAGKTEEHSRRQYFRLSAMDAIEKNSAEVDSSGKLKATVREVGEPEKCYRTRIINISGGGMLFAFYDAMPHLNSIFDIELTIEGSRVIAVKGKLSRIVREMFENEMVFKVGVIFLEINETDREAIINFVFDEQKKTKSAPGLNLKA